ncbi:cbb3-type cytochrome oxidase assembly protein CcoS [Marinobacterium mangrovicola]|uniref:Cbb3-type cytochrome oxidase maturation protein n=1 Tax=Marinobacterium mangrovicola TaxID=1476959 RepID=A0A4R1GLT2_9GAMM|nr:cbb3-type cytochrome oxidase assembly protein CcoS [Marinobacterium mangrovicola]TCK09494.1 cbb3-type cytochrome oxidase maturation protein [Marinobacterium mangrovicola]
MSIIYLLIPIAIILASIAIWAFFWSVNSGQFDDLESPAHKILYDDDDDLIPNDAKKGSVHETGHNDNAGRDGG